MIHPGINSIELRRISGAGPLYAVAFASSWARAEVVKPSGSLLHVERTLVRQKTQPTLIGSLQIVPEPQPLEGEAGASEEVTADVRLSVPNELEYVMVEVPKPAGCEPLNPLSGWDARLIRVEDDGTLQKADENGNLGQPIYREERDDRSVFFINHLTAGVWEIRFGLRAITPGDFSVLPVKAGAMYVPEVRANSDARRLKIAPSP